jgi:hypothetical protein
MVFQVVVVVLLRLQKQPVAYAWQLAGSGKFE